MARLTRSFFSSLFIVLFPISVFAAQITITFDEPAAAGNDCNSIKVYYCYGVACSPNALAAEFPASDANCGEVARDLIFTIDIKEEFVPGTMCFRVTVINTARNENAGVISCVSVS